MEENKIEIAVVFEGREYKSLYDISDLVTMVRHIVMRALGFPSNLLESYELKLGSSSLDEHKSLKELELPHGAVLVLSRKGG